MSKEKFYKSLSVVFGIIIVILLVTLFAVERANTNAVQIGGTIHNTAESFDDGIKVNGTAVIDSSRAITATTGTYTSTLTANGIVQVGNTASSTLKVGAASKSGCITLGDSANGANVVYITATGATITAATTTKPAACQ